jgi:hypothetical protein
MYVVIWIFVAALAVMGGVSLTVLLWDGGVALRRRVIGQKLAAEEQIPEQIAAIENHKSADDGSFDFD